MNNDNQKKPLTQDDKQKQEQNAPQKQKEFHMRFEPSKPSKPCKPNYPMTLMLTGQNGNSFEEEFQMVEENQAMTIQLALHE